MSPVRRPTAAPLALGLAVACCAAAFAGWVGEPVFLGAASLAVITLTLAYGWRRHLGGAIVVSLTAIFALFSALIAAMVYLEDPAGPPQLWLGLPRPTALLVYAVWPLGVLPSLLFALRFRDTVLQPDKLKRFLAEHSRHRK